MSARRKLLDAAAAIAVSEGVTGLGVDRVVSAAGVSKGAFFYHFASKEEMIRALLDDVAQSCTADVERRIAKGERFTEALLATLLREARDNGPLIHVLVSAVAIDPKLKSTLTERAAEWRRRMIEEDGLSDEEADRLRLMVDGLMISSVLYEGGLQSISTSLETLFAPFQGSKHEPERAF